MTTMHCIIDPFIYEGNCMNRRQLVQILSAVGIASLMPHQIAFAQNKTITVGVTTGPHAQILEEVKKVAARDHLTIKVVEFSDFIQPNAALAAGDLDANSYQHLPFLETQIKDRGYKLANAGFTVSFPLAVYSKKIKALSELKTGDRIGIPNDPTNGGRALLLLESAGLIKLKPNAGLKATPLDIADNPKKLKFVELDAAQLTLSLNDLSAAVINGNYAQNAGLSAKKDGIFVEDANGPYAGLIAVRAEDKDKPWVAQLVKAYRSPEVKKFVETTFNGSVIPTW